MNGGKPCEGNDTETARSCFAPCPGVYFVKKKKKKKNFLPFWDYDDVFYFFIFFFTKNCSEINFIEVQKNSLKSKDCFFSSFEATFA